MKDYPNTPSEVFTPEILAIEPALERPGFMSRLASRSASATMQTGMLAVTKDRCQAQLAKTSMEPLAILSTMEAQLSASTPQSAARYQAIVDAYAMGAMQSIVRGDSHDR